MKSSDSWTERTSLPPAARHFQQAFTLIELVTVIAIVAILMILATPSFVKFQKNSELTSAINNLSSSLSAARTEAMRSGGTAIVEPISGDWSKGWRAYGDTDGDNAYTAGTDNLLDSAPASSQSGLGTDVTITTTSNQFPTDGIAFNGDGYPVQVGTSTFLSGELRLTNTLRSRQLVLQPTGQVRVCDPDSATSTGC